jgi:hypothetical protein
MVVTSATRQYSPIKEKQARTEDVWSCVMKLKITVDNHARDCAEVGRLTKAD